MLTPNEKLKRVVALVTELKDETNEVIVKSRIEALAKEFKVEPGVIAMAYWAKKEEEAWLKMGVRIKLRAK